MKIERLMNTDGTEFSPPKNPLAEKWRKLYPVCDSGFNYSCMFCNKCPYGEYWHVPEEDKDEYTKYRKEVTSYIETHNPDWQTSLKESIQTGIDILK
jgi:hypothetical protein